MPSGWRPGKPVKTVGLFVSLHRQSARLAARPLVEALTQAGTRVRTAPEVAAGAELQCEAVPRGDVLEADLLIVLGGDGSLLHTAAQAAPLGVPVLGVDMGSFGFLADSRLEVLHDRLSEVLSGSFQIEERLMLSAGIRRAESEFGPWPGLNDAVTGVLSYSRVVRFGVSLDGEQVSGYAADGLIVATPTGSTAYSLSAGGPVIEPDVESLLITPICPHTLRTRPVVVSPETVIEVQVRPTDDQASDIVLNVDGRHCADLEPEDVVVVRRADFRAQLARVGGTTFYSRLRDKLSWGVSH